MLRKVKIGDFIYIKSMGIATKELKIKAVGVVLEEKTSNYGGLGEGIPVKWLWEGTESVPLSDTMYKNNVFNNTLYEEFSPEVQNLIIQLVFTGRSTVNGRRLF